MGKRVEVMKTYKLYIGGSFSRTESGRYFKLSDQEGKTLANLCRASRKDFRNAVSAARKAQLSWEERTAYNKAQILYRLAENLEGRKKELGNVLSKETGLNKKEAEKQIEMAIDSWVYFAGWADKFQAVFSSVNPVASSHFNFSILEPSGVVAAIPSETSSFSALIDLMAAVIVGGNVLVVLVPEKLSMTAMTLAEVIHHSDVPASVINILTGHADELLEHMVGHMDVNTFFYGGNEKSKLIKIDELSELNLKRLVNWTGSEDRQNPYSIYDFQEVKTTWHPIEQIGGASASY